MFTTRSHRRFPTLAAATLALIVALTGASLSARVAASDPTPTPPSAEPFPISTLAPTPDAPEFIQISDALSIPAPADLTKSTLIAETAHYRFYAADDAFTRDTIPDLAARAEIAYGDVIARLRGFTPEAGLAEPLSVIIQAAGGPVDTGCGVRGLAMYGEDQIIIFTDGPIDEPYFWGVLSHETAHMIHGESLPGFGNHRPLTEGLATWGSAAYWATWLGADSLDDLVRGYRASGDYLPLAENYDMTLAYEDPDCITYRDILYTEWASFIDWLIREYGFGRFGALMASDSITARIQNGLGRFTEIQPADFEGIYGQPLDQLEARWLDWLYAGDV